MWTREKPGLLAAVLASAAVFVPYQALCAPETRIELRIGDTPDRITRNAPELASYLAEIRKEVRAAEQLGCDFEKEMKKCERENARRKAQRKKLRDCDEVAPIDPIEIIEPGLMIDATLAYRDEKVVFDIPGTWSNDEILAVLELTAVGHGFRVVAGGGEGGNEYGYRFAVIVADNSLLGGRFRPVDSWVDSYPLDFYRLPKEQRGRSGCYKD